MLEVRFLADAKFNQKIVTGLLMREPEIDFELPQAVIPEKMKDPEVLNLSSVSLLKGLQCRYPGARTKPD